MIIPIDGACVIFHEKVVFWPVSGPETSSSGPYEPIGAAFSSLFPIFIANGIAAAKYEIDRLFKIPKGNLFWPPKFPQTPADFVHVWERSAAIYTVRKRHFDGLNWQW